MRWCFGTPARNQRAGVCNGHTPVFGGAEGQLWVGCLGFGKKTRNISNSFDNSGHKRFGRCAGGYFGNCHEHRGGSAIWDNGASDGDGARHLLEASMRASFASLQKGNILENNMRNLNTYMHIYIYIYIRMKSLFFLRHY